MDATLERNEAQYRHVLQRFKQQTAELRRKLRDTERKRNTKHYKRQEWVELDYKCWQLKANIKQSILDAKLFEKTAMMPIGEWKELRTGYGPYCPHKHGSYTNYLEGLLEIVSA
jgi:hypothetical protein